MLRRFPLHAAAFLVALWLGLFLLPGARPAQAEAPASNELATRLEEIATLVDEGEIDEARAALAALAASNEGFDPQSWQRLLDAAPTEAASSLRAAATLLRREQPLPDDARERLEAILARPEFQPIEPSWWDRLLRWVLERLFSFSPPGEAGISGTLQLGMIVGSTLVVAVVLWLFVRGLRQNVVDEEQMALPEGEVPLHASAAQQRASEAASTGDYREAMRLLYLAALLHLDEVGLIRFDRALTNREVLASVGSDAPLRALLAPVVMQFDRVWYGHAPFGQQEFERVRGQLEQLRTLEQKR